MLTETADPGRMRPQPAPPRIRPRLPLWGRFALALALALLAQAIISAVVLHTLYFADVRQAELHRQVLRAVEHQYGLHPSPLRRLLWSPIGTTMLSALVVGLVSLPLLHRLTRRLQRLQRQVQVLGQPDLNARVSVEGRDEVAALGAAFNQTAEQIQGLVQSHKSLLAYTSHELRTPLTRLRMSLEVLARTSDGASAGALAEARRDLAELDRLIGSILLFSRLDAPAPHLLEAAETDVLALAAEEAARDGVDVTGDCVRLRADERLLRHAVRNLLDNARRHAAAQDVSVLVRSIPHGARITVCDRGPGVPAALTERIFEPFVRAGTHDDGSGLGLALVQRIASLHGGRVAYRPRAGGGACFVLDVAALPTTNPG